MKRLTDTRRSIEVQKPVEYHPVYEPRTRISFTITPTTIALALVSLMLLMAYAGAEVGWLMGNGVIWLVGATVLFLMWRDGKGVLSSTLAGVCAVLLIFATNMGDNIMSNSVYFGQALQKISKIGFVILPIWLIFSVFRRRS